jgi:hypothetical protein
VSFLGERRERLLFAATETGCVDGKGKPSVCVQKLEVVIGA